MTTAAQNVSSSRQHFSGSLLALIAAIGFSAKAVMVKLAYAEAVDAVTLLALRMAFSLPFFLVAAVLFGRKQSSQPLAFCDQSALIGLGLIGYYLASLLDFLGLQYITAGLERMILFLYPTMVVLISALFLQQKVGRAARVALLISYVGIALVYWHDMRISQHDTLIGALLVFGSALAYAIYLVGAGCTIARVGATRFTAYVMIVACVACLAQFALTRPLAALQLPPNIYVLAAAMALFSTVLPAFLLAAAMHRIGSTRTSLIGSIGPVSTICLAYVFLGEPLSAVQIGGAILVLTGVLMISLKHHVQR